LLGNFGRKGCDEDIISVACFDWDSFAVYDSAPLAAAQTGLAFSFAFGSGGVATSVCAAGCSGGGVATGVCAAGCSGGGVATSFCAASCGNGFGGEMTFGAAGITRALLGSDILDAAKKKRRLFARQTLKPTLTCKEHRTTQILSE